MLLHPKAEQTGPPSSSALSLWTTRKSYEPATARASSFRFEPAKQELTVGPDLTCARPGGWPPRSYLASKGRCRRS